MMNRYAELAVWHGSCFAIMEQIYKNNLGKGVFPIKMSLFSGVFQKSVISAFYHPKLFL